jgi:hypothetical protein
VRIAPVTVMPVYLVIAYLLRLNRAWFVALVKHDLVARRAEYMPIDFFVAV